ncbi:parathyroid hormone 1a [Salvelinus fontinalis]|uniref:parathyroid hormone 1a n=1 Tax=Salvelinus fontinalis TaxID=8038 RepID=UPI002485142F|nr:parathyroid hormone 1a [Salvelinus fontinalis]
MFPIRGLDIKVVLVSLCILYYSTLSEGRPLRKRSVSEVQLMHNLGEHKHVQLRQDWLQMKLRDIHTASLRNAERVEKVRTRSLLPEDLPDLEELTSNEVKYMLEKLLNAH